MYSTCDVYTLKSYNKLRVYMKNKIKTKQKEILCALYERIGRCTIHFLCEIEYVSQSMNPYDCNVTETSYRVSNVYALYRSGSVIMGSKN